MNEAKQAVSISDLTLKTVISLSQREGKAYVFVGDTPRAQLAVEIPSRAPHMGEQFYKKSIEGSLKKIFPFAEIQWQENNEI